NEQLLFETTPPDPVTMSMDPMVQDMLAYSYSFGLNVETDRLLLISVAAFAKTSRGYCYRRGGVGAQPSGFRLLTSLPVLLDEPQINVDEPSNCYDVLEGQTRPLITGISAQIDRPAGSAEVSGVLVLRGWNFSPRAT